MKCPKCDTKMINVDALDICPECYHIEIDDKRWKGKSSKCPKCKSKVKLFETPTKGHVFHCSNCDTVGNVFHHKDLEKKKYRIEKESQMGQKLSWLLEVPCPYWPRKQEVMKTICPKCTLKGVCDEHTEAIWEFCKHKDFDIYISADFIEIVHK
jgi:hypothetical protein